MNVCAKTKNFAKPFLPISKAHISDKKGGKSRDFVSVMSRSWWKEPVIMAILTNYYIVMKAENLTLKSPFSPSSKTTVIRYETCPEIFILIHITLIILIPNLFVLKVPKYLYCSFRTMLTIVKLPNFRGYQGLFFKGIGNQIKDTRIRRNLVIWNCKKHVL